jgi:hypothetical protein
MKRTFQAVLWIRILFDPELFALADPDHSKNKIVYLISFIYIFFTYIFFLTNFTNLYSFLPFRITKDLPQD